MNWRIPRLAASLLLASGMSLGTLASASAQTVKPGTPPAQGVTLEQALAAALRRRPATQ
jgi:hypothetical protein